MAESSIEWTNRTWNPTTGCTKISKECDNCYAEKESNRYMHNPKQIKYKLGFNTVVEHADSLLDPYTWNKPQTVFVNSMSDLFHKDVSLDFIKRVFDVMNKTPQHTYQVLTKRHDILEQHSKHLNWTDNIWMGVSVGTKIAKRRIDYLKRTGAKHKFLSIEPLIEDLGELDLSRIDLVFVGGENGDNSVRPMKLEWVLNVKDACKKSNTAFFFKQWGMKRNNPDQNDPSIDKNHKYHAKGGSMLEGRLYLNNPSVIDDTVSTLKVFDEEYLVMDEKWGLKTIWELKSYLPAMESELYDQLKDSIKKNGLIDPVLFYTTKDGDKLVIEGHTRFSAAISLKLKDIPNKEIKEKFDSIDDIKLWIVKHQFQRRNLSNIEKIELAYFFKDEIEKKASENLSIAGKGNNVVEKVDTSAEIAKIAGVGRASVVRYASVISKGSNSLVQKMRKGEITIAAASKKIVESKPKKITKPSKPNYILIDSMKIAKEKIKIGELDMILMIEEKQLTSVIPRLSKKMGVLLLK